MQPSIVMQKQRQGIRQTVARNFTEGMAQPDFVAVPPAPTFISMGMPSTSKPLNTSIARVVDYPGQRPYVATVVLSLRRIIMVTINELCNSALVSETATEFLHHTQSLVRRCALTAECARTMEVKDGPTHEVSFGEFRF